MTITFRLITFLFICIGTSSTSKPKFTQEEFLNHTWFSSLTLSPNDGQSILIQTKHRIWDQNINEEHLHLQTLHGANRTLITTHASSFKPQWKDDFIALILDTSLDSQHQQDNSSDQSQYIHLYSIRAEQTYLLPLGREEIHAFTWSTTSMSLYFATRSLRSKEEEEAYKNEWKDVIEYREQHRGDTIYRVDINENMIVSKIELLTSISLRVDELICSPDGKQLVFSTQPVSLNQEKITDYELYSLDLTKQTPSIAIRLTSNLAIERNLKWSIDGLLFFTVTGEGSVEGDYEDNQGRLYSLNITTNRIQRWANQFHGAVTEYELLEGGRQGVLILGQLSTEIQVYTQQSVNADLIKLVG